MKTARSSGRAEPAWRRPSQAPIWSAGAIEQSNVSLVERMASLTEVSRSFEALQRGVTILMNDIDGRAITELGRR